MGVQEVNREFEAEQLRSFEKSLLRDVRALEHMLNHDMIESEVQRIGAEQELFIIDDDFRPALLATEILKDLHDSHYTPELALFNLEFNVDPLPFTGNCLSEMEAQVTRFLNKARNAARKQQADIVLVGILPTLRKSDLGLDTITPRPRYYALNDALVRLRGDDYELFLKGTDDLQIKHDSVMLESCNTSFQVHFQVSAQEFAKLYNFSQVAIAPIMAIATNSPLLFGKRLWQETRIALFQQSLDTRQPGQLFRERTPRVSFGNRWVKESVLEIFQEDISRFRVLLATDVDEDPFEALNENRPPKLRALQLHNSTIYRWNRPCYGIIDGKAHLRIENRVLPSGPTVIDEVANATFWFGIINGLALEYDDITQQMDFDDAKTNFLAASRRGLNAQLVWIDGKTIPAQELIQQRLIPLARESLHAAGIDSSDVDRYLEVIERRVSTNQTGSQWLLHSFAAMKKIGTLDECLSSLTETTLTNQKNGKPVHEWDVAKLEKKEGLKRHNYLRVEQYMTQDLFTVNQDDIIDLATCLMEWQHIRHVPVENDQHQLVGIISFKSLLRLVQTDLAGPERSSITVKSIMLTDIPTVAPDTHTLDAIQLMKEKSVSCVPVVKNDQLVGIVTEYDFVKLAARLLEEKLKE